MVCPAKGIYVNIAIYTHGMDAHNMRLMPWRVAIEVSSAMSRMGHRVVVLSAGVTSDDGETCVADMQVVNVPKLRRSKDIEHVAKVCITHGVEVLYYPLGWCSPLQKIRLLETRASTKIIWYVPCAWYGLSHIIRVLPHLGARATFPYLRQAVVPRVRFVRRLLSIGKRPVITMTDYNKRMLSMHGYPDEYITYVPPGKAPLSFSQAATPIFDSVKSQIGARPYFLFFGPPQAVRGIHVLLAAFKKLCKRYREICLVCLFRSDRDPRVGALQERSEHLPCDSRRLFCIWQSVSNAELDAFLRNCYAVLKPFLVVPSEIPLAIIEAAGYGKPVVSTDPEGAGHFVREFGLMVPPASSEALARAMRTLLADEKEYASKVNEARRIYAAHPDWHQVAERWLQCASHVN